ncbi:MAG: MFS transporter [Chromatiaceae bacterium]|nr:MFS transporter [Chromatiaceae bacterium]
MTRARPPYGILLLTVFGFSTLYAPQPLLPVLAEAFGRGPTEVSLLITLAMLPLAGAPLVYGYLLVSVPARPMLAGAALLLALCQLGLALADTWWLMLALRLMIGLCLPALFTALMTFVAASATAENLRQSLAWYIAATILGGFAGRALSGFVASVWDWRLALGIWAPALLVMGLWTLRLPGRQESRFVRVTPRVFRVVMERPGAPQAYLTIFSIFFVFAAVLNVLPFQMADQDPGTGTAGIGFAYLGYLSGLLVSLNTERLSRLFQSEGPLYALGLGLYALGLGLFALSATVGVYLAMFAFCGGMFLIHTRLSGQVNQMGGPHRGVVNGIYIAAYYLGGSLGSWLAVEVYRHLGWLAFLAAVALVLVLAGYGLRGMLRREAKPASL